MIDVNCCKLFSWDLGRNEVMFFEFVNLWLWNYYCGKEREIIVSIIFDLENLLVERVTVIWSHILCDKKDFL